MNFISYNSSFVNLDDSFILSQGDDVLFQVVKADMLDDHIQINKTTFVEGDLEVNGKLVVEICPLSVESKAILLEYMP